MKRLGYLIYLVNPYTTFFDDASQVPAYITEAIPFFVGLLIIEQLIAFYKGIHNFQINDAITSAGQGILMEQTKLFFPTFNIFFYTIVYERYRLLDLPIHSLWTWILALILIDFGFYWFHRACHEVNFLWATHQVHHSSEYFNLTTALRQSVPQLYFHTAFYLPLALFLPPSIYLVHFEFNTLFQFWIHTELVNDLGFLGIVFNTPSHHRVHHGRNAYCIDRNYASVLIIWDKMFGTFSPENEKVIYGLTTPVRTFDPLTLQFGHYWTMMKDFASISDWRNKVLLFIKGPGWTCEAVIKRSDSPDDSISATESPTPFQQNVSPNKQLYCALHFCVLLFFHVQLTQRLSSITQVVVFIVFAFIFLSLTSFGALMEGKKFGEHLELFRCFFFVFLDQTLNLTSAGSHLFLINLCIKIIFFSSLLFWTVEHLNQIKLFDKIAKDISYVRPIRN